MTGRPWQDLARSYLASRVARHALARLSRQNYAYTLQDLTDFLEAEGVPLTAGRDVLVAAVWAWVDSHAWSASTTCTNLGVVRPFLAWGAEHGGLAGGVAALLPSPRKPKLLPRAQSAEAIDRLLAVVPDARGRAIVLLQAQAGLRRAEVAAIQLRDITTSDGRLVVHGKGGKERVVWLSDETVTAVRLWLVQRGAGPGALISCYARPGKGMTPTYVGALVARWLKEAGLKAMPRDGVSSHSLRHSAATNLLRSGANIRVVQEALGHENITTTARYLRADDAEVRDAMRQVSYGRRLRSVDTA